jgi:hypothetical protein
MNGFAKFKVEEPTCFGSHEKFSGAAAECAACKSFEACERSIDVDKLLDDLPDPDKEESRQTLSSVVVPRNTANDENLPASVSTVVSPLKLVSHSSANLSPAADPVTCYSFPRTTQRNYSSVSDAELIETLSKLVTRAFRGSAPLGYAVARNDICAINLEMNIRQRIAPRFRPLQKLERKPRPGDETEMARDRQVIDLHWRAFSSSKPHAAVQNYPGIFDAPDFSLAMAERFALEEWNMGAKSVHLHLTEEMQWEHAVIQAKSIRDKWRAIEFGIVTKGTDVKQLGTPQVEETLRAAMGTASHKHIPGLVHVWVAQRIAGDSPVRVAKWVSLMSGEKPRDTRAVRRSMKSLDTHLTKVKASV